MFSQGEESPSRKLVRIEGQKFRGWGCSACAWVFHPSDPPIVKPLDEMKRNYQMHLSQEFESHDCPEHPRTS
jgi:rubredoxin